MLKMISIFIIFLGCSYMGFYYGENFKRRSKQLNSILKSVFFLNNEVIYATTPLPEALEYISHKVEEPLKKLFIGVSKELKSGESLTVYEAFSNEYKKYKGDFYLHEDDKKVLKDFIKSLGESGVYGQDKLFNLTIENLKINCKVAEEVSSKNTKMYRGIGVCVGAMIAIFLL
ncbi:stage III sporulation protein SpoIIIAB [Clostridium carnis]